MYVEGVLIANYFQIIIDRSIILSSKKLLRLFSAPKILLTMVFSRSCVFRFPNIPSLNRNKLSSGESFEISNNMPDAILVHSVVYLYSIFAIPVRFYYQSFRDESIKSRVVFLRLCGIRFQLVRNVLNIA